MKVLIWIACFLCMGAVQTAAQSFGILLGAIPTVALYVLVFVGATFLCKKWDLHDAKKKAAAEGITVLEYAKKGLKNDFIEQLEETVNTKSSDEVKSFLKKAANDCKISKQQYIVFLKEYCPKK